MISTLNTTKGHNYENNVGGVMILSLCISSDKALYLNQVSENYLKGFRKIISKDFIYGAKQFPH